MFKKNKATVKTAEQQLADIAGELVKQNRRASRMRLLIVLFVIIYFGSVTFIGISQSDIIDNLIKKEHDFVAEVSLSGIIADGGKINNEDATTLLEEAFSATNSRAVILRLNSGGGSPVQSAQIYRNIKRLKDHYKKKIYVVIEDICASGCYYIASSADEIYADKSSIIGSIGVVLSSFGVEKAIAKLGIERRLYTAGKNKAMLDIFSPEDPIIKKHLQEKVLDVSHQNFINDVKQSRKNKLINNDDIFSGLVWLGNDAKKLGLIDGIGDSYFVANKIIGIDSRIKFEQPKTLIEQFMEISFNMLFTKQKIQLQ